MQKRTIAFGLAALALCSQTLAESWSYEGHTGPDHWGNLAPEYAMCALGSEQSPVDILHTIEDEGLNNLRLRYNPTRLKVVNNGHALKVPVEAGSSFDTRLYGEYQLLQFHFHAGSEHTVMGMQYPLEVHFVHGNDEGQLAVVGVLFEAGDYNPTLQAILNNAPAQKGEILVDGATINPRRLLPEDREYFHYSGSLTTPPCSEGVEWFVMDEPLEASPKQLAQFESFYSGNFRPVQPLNHRMILEQDD
ncbi:carbonic anhydrase [Microbulbifer aggregans]|uniref:carbonic anhydrase n=1 Tax=Microbulbifer aggregans TaxID=1769779 RepID=UPI001CFE695B|nr:carbonic anhydrase family protein [Microbulbifer aggregans]